MLLHYIKTSYREMIRYKMQSIVSIVGLALGFTAFVFGGYWYWWEHNFDTFHPESDRLYCLTTTGIGKKANGMPSELNQLNLADREQLFTLLPEIEAKATFSTTWAKLNWKGDVVSLYGLFADREFFDVFMSEFLSGTYQGVAPDGQSVVITESLARRFYGSVNCVGQVLPLRENWQPVIVGVVKDYPPHTEIRFQYIVLQTIHPDPQSYVNRATVYVRLREDASVDRVHDKLNAYKSQAETRRGKLEEAANWVIRLRSAAEAHLTTHSELENRIRNIGILALAGLMAFVSSLLNILVLFIGQQQRKQRKNLTHQSFGASPRNMMLKGWIELFLPMVLGFMLTYCFIEILFPYYRDYTAWNDYGIYEGVNQSIKRVPFFSNTFFYMIISAVVFSVLCYFPIRHMIRRQTANPVILKKGLIVGQIFIGSLFFLSSIVLFQQLRFVLFTDRGLDYENVIQIDMGFSTAYEENLSTLKPELLNHPAVEKVTYTAVNSAVLTEMGDYYGSMITQKFVFSEADMANLKEWNLMFVDEDFFDLFGIKLQRGDWLTGENSRNYLVNEKGFNELGYQDLTERPMLTPQHITNTEVTRVCGVVNDYYYCPFQYPIQPVFFQLLTEKEIRNFPAHYIYVRYQPGKKKEVMAHIEQVTGRVNRNEVNIDKRFIELSALVDTFNKPEKVIFTLFSLLAFLCILISSFGIYSLVSLSTEQRKKEIAIRKVNGAGVAHIMQIFFREYLVLAIIGNTFALSFGYILMKRWLETYAYHVSLSVGMFVLVFLLTSAIVILSIFQQVRKAARINPAEAVKSE
ncbi:ABC-type antimicrobial peptide transport system permease subunit [Parabacteroides sp. PFB2-10]|uniref:ABC transporter permease n=1 Tax=Parabacteroides sp. PFB2-10 TaxID=1742405 RepID=UPI002474869C|nr:FtsX-like permease family protein [Parabacteroides sp. PFB2-10]MDH6312971.1 ABC-type antimicrobial peptide transport system permease subunit [Parabacteroides sp. PFB2-10]MDL2245480.1 ABC transporter permease [Parabacteroides sp. OttesenSCG-928-J18]